jgi:hypothetical protein
LGEGLNITDTTQATISDVNGYVAFVFIGLTAGGSSSDGYNSIVIPRTFITATNKKFVFGHATDSKTFYVNIDATGKMTVTGSSIIGTQGIASN